MNSNKIKKILRLSRDLSIDELKLLNREIVGRIRGHIELENEQLKRAFEPRDIVIFTLRSQQTYAVVLKKNLRTITIATASREVYRVDPSLLTPYKRKAGSTEDPAIQKLLRTVEERYPYLRDKETLLKEMEDMFGVTLPMRKN